MTALGFFALGCTLILIAKTQETQFDPPTWRMIGVFCMGLACIGAAEVLVLLRWFALPASQPASE